MSGDEGLSRTPAYHLSTLVNGHVVGEFMSPISDPLVRTTVSVGWCELLCSLLTRRTLTVEVMVGSDSDTATRLLELDPDYLGPPGSASRTAWDAALHGRLSGAASSQQATP